MSEVAATNSSPNKRAAEDEVPEIVEPKKSVRLPFRCLKNSIQIMLLFKLDLLIISNSTFPYFP